MDINELCDSIRELVANSEYDLHEVIGNLFDDDSEPPEDYEPHTHIPHDQIRNIMIKDLAISDQNRGILEKQFTDFLYDLDENYSTLDYITECQIGGQQFCDAFGEQEDEDVSAAEFQVLIDVMITLIGCHYLESAILENCLKRNCEPPPYIELDDEEGDDED